MEKRGRKSAASLAIPASSPVEIVPRQRPPHDLSDEEVGVWVSVVNDMPADWFSPSTVPLLAQYCRHVIHAERIAGLIEKVTGGRKVDIAQYDALLRMLTRESRAIASLSTKMRLSQQATTNHRGNKQAPEARKPPWEL